MNNSVDNGEEVSRRDAETQREQAKNLPFTYRYLNGVPPVMKRDKQGAGKRIVPKIGRNEPCPCGSKLKFKKCCQDWPTFARKQQEIKKANEAREVSGKETSRRAAEPQRGEDLNIHSDFRKENYKINCYKCSKCGGLTSTVDIHIGVTPFKLHCNKCDSLKTHLPSASSMMYPRERPIPENIPYPEYEWYKKFKDEECLSIRPLQTPESGWLKHKRKAGEPPALPGDESCKKCGGTGTYRYESSSEASYSVFCECPAGNKKQKQLKASENITSGGES